MKQIYIIKAFDFVQKEAPHHEKFKDRKVEGGIYIAFLGYKWNRGQVLPRLAG